MTENPIFVLTLSDLFGLAMLGIGLVLGALYFLWAMFVGPLFKRVGDAVKKATGGDDGDE